MLAASAPKERTGRKAAPLAGLTSAAFSANARLIKHLLGTREDGLVPSLMADDFRLGLEGRAKTADFLGQLFKSIFLVLSFLSLWSIIRDHHVIGTGDAMKITVFIQQ